MGHPVSEKGEIAQARIAGKDLAQSVGNLPRIGKRERRLVSKAQPESHTAHMGVKRNEQVGRRLGGPDSEVHFRVPPHHPSEKHVELLLGASVGNSQESAQLLHRTSAETRQRIFQRPSGRRRIHPEQLLKAAPELRIRKHPIEAARIEGFEIVRPRAGQDILQRLVPHHRVQLVRFLQYLLPAAEAQHGGQQPADFNVLLPGIAAGELNGVGNDERGLVILPRPLPKPFLYVTVHVN